MSNSSTEFLIDNLQPNIHRDLGATATNYATITDIQQGANYQSGQITYNNVQLQSTTDGSFYILKDALMHVPMTYKLSIVGGTFDNTKAANNYNINAVTKKSNKHFIHNSWCKLGGVDLVTNNGIGFQNLYLNESYKANNPSLSYLNDELNNYYLDNHRSFAFDVLAGEANNNTKSDISVPYNEAFTKRNKHYFDINNSPLKNYINQTSLSQNFYPYFDNGGANSTALTWYDILELPLSEINNVYAEAPPLIRLNGFEFKLQFNAGSSVVYTSIQTATAGPPITFSNPTAETVTIGNGGTFPLMLSNLSADGSTALSITPTSYSAGGIVLTLTVNIGWSSNPSPTRVLIPYSQLSTNALNTIVKQRIYNFSSKVWEIDTSLTGVSGSSNINRTLATHYRQTRKLYILPFFSTQNKFTVGINCLAPYQNARSSAPNTISPLRLKNFNVTLAGKSLFPQEIQSYPVQFFDEAYLKLNSKSWSMGNARDNPLQSGMITKAMWLSCYGTYIVDLNRYENDADDLTLKSIGLNFTCDGTATYLYDFFIIVECERNYAIDVIEGTLQQSSIESAQ